MALPYETTLARDTVPAGDSNASWRGSGRGYDEKRDRVRDSRDWLFEVREDETGPVGRLQIAGGRWELTRELEMSSFAILNAADEVLFRAVSMDAIDTSNAGGETGSTDPYTFPLGDAADVLVALNGPITFTFPAPAAAVVPQLAFGGRKLSGAAFGGRKISGGAFAGVKFSFQE